MSFSNPDGPDRSANENSQGYLTAIATRVLVFIESDNPAIGMMCFVGVGLVEVSTCDVTVKVGDLVKKGDQLGMFHFGGSTYCLVFRPEAKVTFWPQKGESVLLNVPIGAVTA